MKKIFFGASIVAVAAVLINMMFVQSKSIDTQTIKVTWTAYKTTAKIPVSGEFKKVEVSGIKSGTTVKDMINGSKISIPVSSLFSNNESRDNLIKKFFFGVMDKTELLSGVVSVTDDKSGSIHLKMNGIEQKLAFMYSVTGDMVELNATMMTDDWKGQAAIESMNKACFDLHKGADGISKLWNEVGIKATVALKK